MQEMPDYRIDNFAVFESLLLISGWIGGIDADARVTLRMPGTPPLSVPLNVRGHSGPAGLEIAPGGFSERIQFDPSSQALLQAEIVVERAGHSQFTIQHLGFPRQQPAAQFPDRFKAMLAQRPPGAILEIGSRARSGVVRRGLAPEAWVYTGLDIIAGPNVDVVGDIHKLSELFPAGTFDAVMSFSVFEHLLMPWKAAIELNRVLKPGGVGLITTHQAWPLHEEPWDFWRFSDQAWRGLFNRDTGFEILDAQMGEPAYIVPQRIHAVTAWGRGFTGCLASNVIFRKVAETNLEWNVTVTDALDTSYPGGEQDMAH